LHLCALDIKILDIVPFVEAQPDGAARIYDTGCPD
jgi:hypothetical protein